MGSYSTCVVHNATTLIPISVLRDKPSHSHIPSSSSSSSRTLLPLFINKLPSLPSSSSSSTNYLHCHLLHRFPLFYSKRNANEDQLSSSEEEEENKNSILHHDDDISSTIDDASNTLTYTSSVNTVAFWVCSAIAFGVGLGFKEGVDKASEFFAGYILEQSLSVDNLFVFVLIFKYFKVPLMYQNRVLSYGIAGAVFFRLTLILLGTVTLQRFEAVNLFLAAILLYSSIKLFASEEDESDLSNNFVVKTCQKFIPVTTYYDGSRFITNQDGVWKATPLLLTVAVIELSDIVFAVDSIPAVFGVTRDPFIVFTSNMFAILGLRSLYTIISESMSELEYLQPSIAVVLGFIGCKMILDYFGLHVSTEVSLGFVASSLTIGALLSLAKKSDQLKK
ncbi:PREDICTED: thylakoid membrane protein TERC, chloroplastic-like [Lupinus angustifolius]|uniref:thylakoid membrane protein TERC, chloroplastic-like n=1 Tax=Lupinus angustifolius TaxID=3871 RepID=UPI00092FD616|nr:PREDICTED: thylakoid membrane protein TERC, chloroplastic-like [Lupinus angustifolius]